MKKTIALSVVVLFLSLLSKAQLITVTPALPTDLDGVEVIFDATQGNGGLAGYTGDVYAHTGVLTNLSTGSSNWRYVKADWGVNIPDCKLTSLGNDKWKLTITPSIREYYGVPADETILQLAFVFRSGVKVNGSWLEGKTATGGDIFYDVYPAGLSVKITNPDQNLIFAQINQPFAVSVTSSFADTTKLYSNGALIASTTGNTIDQSITPDAYGRFLVKAVALNDTGMVADSFYFYVRPDVTVAGLPAGITDGINYIANDSVVLCLYAPLKEYAFVIGDFNNWLPDEEFYMYRTPDGDRYWCPIGRLIPGKEYIYQYLVDGSVRIGDPYAAKVSDPWNDTYIDEATYPGLIGYPAGKTSGIATVLQTDKPQYSWQTGGFAPPSVTDLVIYELLIRDFTTEHSFQSVIDTLGYLKRMGVNAIELMPVSEFEGNLSWGYNPNYYFAVDKYYGTENKFKELIDACHQQGISVIMDIVLNHAFGTSPYVMLYWDAANNRPSAESPFYNPIAKHDFNVGFDMNHESAATKEYVSRILKYWLTEFRVDGFRFDLSKGFTQNNTLGNTTAWGYYDPSRISILSAYNDTIQATNPAAVLILEHFADNTEENELSTKGMLLWGNMNYQYGNAAKGNTAASNFSNCSYASRGWMQPHLVGYMESHDEERQMFMCISEGVVNGDYSVKDTSTALKRAALAATFFFTIPGPKMIWQFGEQGYDYSINYPSGTSASRLDNKPPRWDYLSQYRRMRLYNTFTSLIKLRTENPLFETRTFSLDVSGAMKKIKLRNDTLAAVVLGNFGTASGNMIAGFYSAGTWYDYLTGDSLTVQNPDTTLTLAAGEARLYMTRKVENPYGIQTTPARNLQVSIAPNPVTDQSRIVITYPSRVLYTVSVYDLQGRQNCDSFEGKMDGTAEIIWYPKHTGVYLVRVQAGKEVVIKKVIAL